jgi:predicted negative regulator of RcsB-dependent stress response
MKKRISAIIIVCVFALSALFGCASNVSDEIGESRNESVQGTSQTASDESKGADVAPSDSDNATDTKEDFAKLTYEEYNALSGAEQELYFNKFDSLEAFFEWYNAAKKEYDDKENSSDIIIGGESMDFDGIFGGDN